MLENRAKNDKSMKNQEIRKGITMQIKHLKNSRTILEIIILCIVYISMATGVYVGLAGNDAGNAYYCLIVVIPVLVTYYARKHIKSYPLFICLNLVFVFIAAGLSKSDIEFAGYVCTAVAIVAHSIRLKGLYVQKKQYENAGSSTDYSVSGRSKDDMQLAVGAGEKLHMAYCVFMIAFYIVGSYHNNTALMGIQLFLFMAFVICQFFYSQLSELYKIFVTNEGKSEFPARRIMRINVGMMIIFAIFMILGMLLFYNGRYGNIFQTIGAGLMAVLKVILRILLWLIGRGPVSEPHEEETTAATMDWNNQNDDLNQVYNNTAANALMEVVAICAIIGVLVAIIYAIVKYAKKFSRSLDNDGDEVEYLNNDVQKEQNGIKLKKAREVKDKNNIQYRKLYKKYARSKKYMTKNKMSGTTVSQEMMPEEITKKLITDDEEKSRIITKNYEKARYSDEEVSKDDIEFLKKL